MPVEGQQNPVVPLPYDIVWSLVGLLWLLIPIAIAVTERRRGASWVETFFWFALAVLLPILGLVIWALYRVVGAKKGRRNADGSTPTTDSTV